MTSIAQRFFPVVLCAGFGSRLRPLTDYVSKVACPILDKPVAFLNIEILFKAGFEKVHCNVHYLANDVQSELRAAAVAFGYDPERLVFWREEEILETGGGIQNIYNSLVAQNPQDAQRDALVVSGDIVADFPLGQMLAAWDRRPDDALALMCTKELWHMRKDATWISADGAFVVGFGEGAQDLSAVSRPRLFTNHQIISHKLLRQKKVEKKTSVELFYQTALRDKKKIIHLDYPSESQWFNVGTFAEYRDCLSYFAQRRSSCASISCLRHLPEKLKEDILGLLRQQPDKDKWRSPRSDGQDLCISLPAFFPAKRNFFIPLALLAAGRSQCPAGFLSEADSVFFLTSGSQETLANG